MRVAARRAVATDVEEFVLAPGVGTRLPGFTPGAHIGVRTPSGAMRRYSLLNDGRAPNEYVIAVKREAASRGGSRSMHEMATVGTRLDVEPPQNDFELRPEGAALLIAGGIGITPIIAMARSLVREQRDFELIYCARDAEHCPYLAELEDLVKHLTVHFDGGDPTRFLDLWDWFETPRDLHVYCCGPGPLMEEVRAVSGHWPDDRIHFEDFKPVDVVRPGDRPFDVVLAGSGRRIRVPADRSLLEALRDAGIRIASSCESGTCGTCRTHLVAGEVEHRDRVLLPEERREFIMPCVSRARGDELSIDLEEDGLGQ